MERSDAFDHGAEKLHFLDYWQVVSKRKEVIIATFLIIVFIATVLSLIMPSTYTGIATIKVESSIKDPDVVVQSTGRPEPVLAEDLETQKEQLKSHAVLDRVVRGDVQKTVYACPLHKTPELDAPTEDNRCTWETCDEMLVKKKIDKYPEWEPLNEKWAKRDKRDRPYTTQETLLALSNSLAVEVRRGTTLIDVAYVSRDRNEAADVANMLCDVYLQYADQRNKEKADAQLSTLREETWEILHGVRDPVTGEVKKKGLMDLESELATLEREHRLIIDSRTGSLMEWVDFSPLIQQQTQLKALIAAEEGTLNDWKALNKQEEEKRWAVFSTHQSVLNLKQALVAQRTELSQALQTLNKEHPTVKAIEQLISDIKLNLETEIDGIIFNKEQQVDALKEQVNSLADLMREHEDIFFNKKQKLVEYNRLRREIESMHRTYGMIAQTEVVEAVKLALPPATLTIAQKAAIPIYASGPNRIRNIILSVVVGGVFGLGLAYFIEYLDTSIKTIDDIERTLGMQILGVIPQKVRILTEESQNSPSYEAYRILWTNIEFARQENRIQSLLVTSGGVAEGKTTTIVNLAIAIANSGLNVLLVDSDFRRPRVHRLLDVSNQTGLSDILMKNADPDGVIARTSVPNLWVVPSGKVPPNAVGLLTSKRLKECVDHFANKYDIVLYDSPPVLGLSDSAVLASLVDRVLLCVEYRKYPKSISLRAKKTLEGVGGKILGAVINNINVLKEDPTYYSQVYHYFQAPEEQEHVPAERAEKKRKKGAESTGRAFEDDDGWR
jgi:capsular exopolysaccharide synthesis family protein